MFNVSQSQCLLCLTVSTSSLELFYPGYSYVGTVPISCIGIFDMVMVIGESGESINPLSVKKQMAKLTSAKLIKNVASKPHHIKN